MQSGPYLTPFFLRFATYLGANPYRAPAVLHNIAWVEAGAGRVSPGGGMRALADRLYALALAQGVQFAFGHRVLKIWHRRGWVEGVETDQGRFQADLYISAADRHFTLQWLGLPMPGYALGVSGFALLLKLSEAVPLGHHIYFSSDYRAEWREIAAGRWPRDPTLYLHTDGQAAFLLVNAPPMGRARPRKPRTTPGCCWAGSPRCTPCPSPPGGP